MDAKIGKKLKGNWIFTRCQMSVHRLPAVVKAKTQFCNEGFRLPPTEPTDQTGGPKGGHKL